MTACGGKEAPAETKKEETKTEAAKEQAEQDSGERPYYVRPASEVTRENHGIYNNGGNSAAGT